MRVSESQSNMYLDSKNGKALIAAIAEGNELELRILYDTGSFVEKATGDDYLKIKKLAQIIVENNAWEYIRESNGNDMLACDRIIEENWPIENKGYNDVKEITPTGRQLLLASYKTLISNRIKSFYNKGKENQF